MMSIDLKNTIKQLEKLCGDIELVSFGLAPNVNGFCFEIYNETVNRKDLDKLSDLLDNLSNYDVEIIKELYL